MPRFSDEWVIDRVLFDFVSGGSCACCGFQHFLANGTADLIGAVTDLETDQAAAEVAALQHHPWPADLRDQVWADRVKLRQKLKLKMPVYAVFWKEHGEVFPEWCEKNIATVNRLLQLPRSEILDVVRQHYGIHSAYGVVLCAVLEQVAHFKLTAYPTDARGDDSEVNFETALHFGNMGGFTMNFLDESGSLKEDVLQIWLERVKSLAGPKLLGRGQSKIHGEDEEGDADGPVATTSAGPSFQSDRRIIRLLIARYWCDTLLKRFLDETQADKTKAEVFENECS
jgi:hypothetical protein